MPKAKINKKKGVERSDWGKSWEQEEDDLLLEFWSREEVKAKLDGTIRGAIGHELMAKYLQQHGFERSTESIKN